MPLTAEEGRRLHVLRRLERGRLTTAQAGFALCEVTTDSCAVVWC
jgi:hypothetical protein